LAWRILLTTKTLIVVMKSSEASAAVHRRNDCGHILVVDISSTFLESAPHIPHKDIAVK
jgi:hypothetical protein